MPITVLTLTLLTEGVVEAKLTPRPEPAAADTVVEPLTVAGALEKFDVRVNVAGGGPNGQADAVRHGISRALIKFDANLRPPLKAEGLLTRDPRMRERKKYGQPGARKRFQFSKR